MDNTELAIKIDHLQRTLNFWRALVILGLACVVAIAATHLGATVTRIDATAVVAQEFDLVNRAGRVTARLAPDPLDPDAAVFVVKYRNDKPAVTVGLLPKVGPSVAVYNSDGHTRAVLWETTTGPKVNLLDEDDGHVRMMFEVDVDKPEITVLNKAMTKKIWSAPIPMTK